MICRIEKDEALIFLPTNKLSTSTDEHTGDASRDEASTHKKGSTALC